MAHFYLYDWFDELAPSDKFMFEKLFDRGLLMNALFFITNCSHEELLDDTVFENSVIMKKRAPDAPSMIYAIVVPDQY